MSSSIRTQSNPRQAVNAGQQQPRPEANRKRSSSSDSSTSSQVTTFSVAKRQTESQQRPQTAQNAGTSKSQNASKPASLHNLNDPPPRRPSPAGGNVGHHVGHRPQRHSQGFFEPSLPSASNSNVALAIRSASQIAAKAAMHVQEAQHARQRSITVPRPMTVPEPVHAPPKYTLRRKVKAPPPIQIASIPTHPPLPNGVAVPIRTAATTAANAAFPKSPQGSPGLQPQARSESPAVKEEPKPSKEKSKMKLFSKGIGMSKDKDMDSKHPVPASPSRTLHRFMNASTTSLADTLASSSASFYSAANGSTSTLVPTERTGTGEKEKHRHHFLSRPKNKLKEEQHHLPLSSASSNSRPTDPHDPQPLYSFAPSSPAPSSAFAKSVSGLDLRHGGRALREKKKEEKAAALGILQPSTTSLLDPGHREQAFHHHSEWPGPSSMGTSSVTPFGFPSATSDLGFAQPSFNLTGFGLEKMTADDAWPYLKSKLLNIFAGEDLRTPIEDFNRLVTAHIVGCVQRRAPTILVEDFRELLQTGFASLDQTLRPVPDEKIVPHLVEMWIFVFGTILPFMQAVFFPLDLEFKGKGTVMSARDAADFWGALPPDSSRDDSGEMSAIPTLGEELDVRRIVLITFRDEVILPRSDALAAIFSRLSLESIDADIDSSPDHSSAGRPATATSLDPGKSSFNSQGSTLLSSSASGSGSGSGGIGSLGARSRATSNTSAGSFTSLGSPRTHLTSHPFTHHPAHPSHPNAPFMHSGMAHVPLALRDRERNVSDPSRITEIVARMLQCVLVLASVQSGDDGQRKIEALGRALKHNWLGRGRTGRNRRGFVGTRGVSIAGSNAPTITAAG